MALIDDKNKMTDEVNRLNTEVNRLNTELIRSKKNVANRDATSGGPFAKKPRVMLVLILEFFSMHEVASLQRLVCHELRPLRP